MDGAGTVVKLPPPSTIATTGSGVAAPNSKAAAPASSAPASSAPASSAPASSAPASSAPASSAPAATTANATGGSGAIQSAVEANVARRRARMENRKRELLAEAREARVAWILDAGVNGKNAEGGGGGKGSGRGGGRRNDGDRLLGSLRACGEDVLPCAPLVIDSMISGGGASRNDDGTMLERLLEEENLAWELVATSSTERKVAEGGGGDDGPSSPILEMATKHPSLNVTPAPNPECYADFLNTLCEPSAANLVTSAQKFCRTIREAANVMVETLRDSEGGTNDAAARIDHGASLAKAIRGFINTTLREMEDHEAFRGNLLSKGDDGQVKDGESSVDEVAKEQLLASLERFVYAKCRKDIDAVLHASRAGRNDHDDGGDRDSDAKTMEELQLELHDKMLSLQFVKPAHLEISTALYREDIDISYTVDQLRSIEEQSSPRQMLHYVLLAHRGVSGALHDASRSGESAPGADDVLPTLILAVLRAHPENLPTSLRLVETFAPPSLLRGEAGYAYTNLCGAMQFVQELDVEGHMAEASLGGMGEGAVLSVGPDEFREGLEACRRRMREAATAEQGRGELSKYSQGDGYREEEMEFDVGDACVRAPLRTRITARGVREARSRGESVDLTWAIKRQNESTWKEGKIENIVASQKQEKDAAAAAAIRGVPPEEPPMPSRFSRSYSFLATRPEDVGPRDLPRLLREYKMLVHATEKLLNERTVWREGERRRMLRLERERLERDFADAMGHREAAANW